METTTQIQLEVQQANYFPSMQGFWSGSFFYFFSLSPHHIMQIHQQFALACDFPNNFTIAKFL